MTTELFNMLKTSAEADRAKELLSLDLLGNKATGIGDHSTEDFYKNAEQALLLLAESQDRLEAIDIYLNDSDNKELLT